MAVSKSIVQWANDVPEDNVKAVFLLVPDEDNASASAASGWTVWSGQTF